MSFRLFPSKRFLKSLKRYQRGGKIDVVQAAEEVTQLLSACDSRAQYVLHQRWGDHALKGNKAGIRELHLGMDDLLLYSIDEETSSIELIDMTNHESLREKK